MRDWPSAPPNTAIAKPTPAAIALVPLALAVAAAAASLVTWAKAGSAAIITPTAAIKNKPIFLIFVSPKSEANLKAVTAGMISPASGIHRPSYNGAPAIQTMIGKYWLLLIRSLNCLAFQRVGRGAASLENAFMKPLSKNGRDDLHAILFILMMTVMWWM